MKKIILSLVFIFAIGSYSHVNADTNINDNLVVSADCGQDAWDFGTELGDGNAEDEYWFTNWYYERHCE